MAKYKIIRQTTWIFKVEADSEEEALEKANRIWDDDLRQSDEVLYHEGTDNIIEED